ncbi:DUF6397 family protein [Streptomyces varsoviensis]|uniref:DUF6397 family protein n=1 Tax=Streptomyces varsoviensis TaxID=67373 RepID=UPI0006920EAC|nr:DUF6397 family protein [Streptomyces varsoviensis]
MTVRVRESVGSVRSVRDEERGEGPDGGRSETRSVSLVAAARELRLKPREFELAVRLGVVRTLPAAPQGRRRVAREEIERHTADPGFPETLRARVWTLGTTEGAALMGISASRFGRLARAGRFAPVSFYVNRYRAVVWLYLAAELAEFADREPDLLTGSVPRAMREALDAGEDRRAREWRHRRREELTEQTADPWARAAVTAALLDPDQLSAAVPDLCERTHLSTLRPALTSAPPDAAAARDVIEDLTVADDPEEIAWLRFRLTVQLEEARDACPAPRVETRAGEGRETVPVLESVSESDADTDLHLDSEREPVPNAGPVPVAVQGPGLALSPEREGGRFQCRGP